MTYTAAVITIDDKIYAGERNDTAGPAVMKMLEEHGFKIAYHTVLPGEKETITAGLIKCADEIKVNLAVTAGGTGFSPRDITPEATLAAIERETRSIPVAMVSESMKLTPRACLFRGTAGIRGNTLIVNLPGSEKAARENLSAVIDALGHGVEMLLPKD